MVENSGIQTQSAKRRSLADLLFWLALLPIILGPIICFGQLALLVTVRNLPANTASLLKVEYLPWPYDLIPAINLPALIEDVARDEQASGLAAAPAPVITGTYWVVPTATAEAVSEAVNTPIPLPPTATEKPAKPPTPLPTATRKNTATRLPTRTATLRPTATTAPTLTATRTWAPLLPTATATDEPEPPATRTPTKTQRPPTATFTLPPKPTKTPVPPTATKVVVPTATFTPITPTVEVPTAEVPTDQPVYVQVVPIAENENNAGIVVEGGCRADFGYFNGNPQPVDIRAEPPLNHLNVEADILPTAHFLVGRQYGSFSVIWNVQGPIIWRLDGQEAQVNWCNPPAQ